ncbi:ABC transporter substrate-binding protein [Streptomyces liliifuscus]|uniref:ABC transporter substrate-binding protein n=1 Tax=Streptomyces liliifuscus TaxID=2797636 RepID=A0A7T7RGK1_9ACTN|nr:ABC transporter substrate-binding protein [Streptomyces liliifuscus]QQM45854.1 ABC transporter substrate-binding protein [Streptomyces liliifuscus]
MQTPFSTRRLLAGPAALTAALLALTACGAGTTDSNAAAGNDAAGPTIRIGVGVDAAYTPFFLADAEGLWAKHGVNVQLVQFGQGSEGVNNLVAGQVQMSGNSDTTTISMLQQSPDLRSLLVYEQSGKYLKVVLGPKVTSPAKIRKMAVAPGLSEMAATRFLESKDIDPKSVEFVTADPPEIPALMKKGDIDAYVLWEPWPTKGVEQGGKVLENTGAYGVTYAQWLLAKSDWLKSNTDTAVKVAEALEEAARLTESDPQAAAEATEKAVKVPAAQTVSAIKEIDFGVRDFTDADLKGYENTAQFVLDSGKVKAKPDVTAVVQRGWFTDNVKGS